MAEIYQFPNVKFLKKVYGEPNANAYLETGWILICSGFDRENNMFIYSLGWPRADEPQYPPGEDDL